MSKIALIHFNDIKRDGSFSWPDIRTSSWSPNYGDILVCASIVRQIGAFDAVRVGFGWELREPADVVVLRGSTYLHNKMDFDAAIKTIDSIDAPIACVGLGAQHPTQELEFLDHNEKAREFVGKLAEKSTSISVRGEFSADVVRRLGGKNVRVTGCPSLFYFPGERIVNAPQEVPAAERRLGVCVHSSLSKNIFCRDPRRALQLHGQIIDFCERNAAELRIFEQGIPLEFTIADQAATREARIEAARLFLARVELTDSFTPESMLERFVCLLTLDEWLTAASRLHAMVGFRFHGNMVALAQGIPCFFYVYDSRIEEFCDLYCLPYQKIEQPTRDPLHAMLSHDWSLSNRAFAACRAELAAFYAENGVKAVL